MIALSPEIVMTGPLSWSLLLIERLSAIDDECVGPDRVGLEILHQILFLRPIPFEDAKFRILKRQYF